MEPSPIYIDPHGDENTGMVIVTRPDWALLGGWIYQAQRWIAAAGPCLGRNRNEHSDVPRPGNGVMQ